MINCKYCDRIGKNSNSNTQHQIRCNKNPDKIEIKGLDVIQQMKESGLLKHSNQYIKAKDLGLPTPTISDETRAKHSKASKGFKWSKEAKLNLSKKMKEIVRDNPDSYSKNNVCGRVKLIEYKGAKLHGNWELLVAKYFDENNIIWDRNDVKTFSYMWNNKEHTYFPDFYLPEYDKYVEVKGYKRDRDIAKWEVVDNLIIIQLSEIKKIKNKSYNIFDYMGL